MGESVIKVSVTVPTYNHGKALGECLESVVNQQTDFPFEVIVGDDASTDGVTREVLADFATRYPHIIVPVMRDANLGNGQNFLDLIRRAKGRYIAHIDGDDLMLPDKLQAQADFLDNNPDCAFVTHNVRIIDAESGALISDQFYSEGEIPDKADINYLCLTGVYFSHCSKMYRNSAILTRYSEKRMIDFYHHIEHSSRGKIGYLRQTFGVYRKFSGSASDVGNQHSLSIENSHLNAFDRALELGVDLEIVKKGRARFLYGRAIAYLRAGKYDEFSSRIKLNHHTFRYAATKHQLAYLLSRFRWIYYFILLFK